MHQDQFRPGRAQSSSRVLLPAAAAALTLALGSGLHAQLPAPAVAPKPPAAPAAQAGKTANLPSARSILDKHVQAMGGRAAILGYSSITSKGTISMPAAGVSGNIEVYALAPNKTFVKMIIPGIGEVTEGFNGTHGWMASAMTGPLLLEGKQLEDKRFDADFHGELRASDRYTSITTLEQTEFDGRQCYKVSLVRKGGGEDIEYFDVQTGLKAGSVITRETPMGAITAKVTTGEYKKFGKLLQPTVVRQEAAGQQQVVTLSTVEYDSVTPSIFDMPAGIKALVK